MTKAFNQNVNSQNGSLGRSYKEISLWALVLVLFFLTGYYRGLKRLETPFQLIREPLRIVTYDNTLFSLDLLDYLEFEMQRPIEVTTVTSWEDLQAQITSSNQMALLIYPSSWAQQAKSQDLVFSRSKNEIKEITSHIHTEFQKIRDTGTFYPWLWAQVFRVDLNNPVAGSFYQLSEIQDLNCGFYAKNIRDQLKYKTENLSLKIDNESSFNSRLITHRTDYDSSFWKKVNESYLLEIVIFETKTSEVDKDIRLKLLKALMNSTTYDFIRKNKPFATALLSSTSQDHKELAEFLTGIELRHLRNIDFCEEF